MNDDITTALISRDPLFFFAARGLLGRDRRVRVFTMSSSLPDLRRELTAVRRIDALVCDADSIPDMAALCADLNALQNDIPNLRTLCLAEGRLAEAARHLGNCAISALLGKFDLNYCLHLAIQAVVDNDIVLLTERSRALLDPSSRLATLGRTLRGPVPHPDLTDRIREIVMWRIFIGLDNPDIQDELLLGSDTVRGYVSTAYKTLGARNELEAFDALSEWWWSTRFEGIVNA
jgi:DNA-binding NarL/FixJ family response regulator